MSKRAVAVAVSAVMVALVAVIAAGGCGGGGGGSQAKKPEGEPEKPAAKPNDQAASDKDRIAECDEMCSVLSKYLATLDPHFEFKTASERATELSAMTPEQRKFREQENAARERVLAEKEKDPEYISMKKDYYKNATEFRAILQKHPEWGATYGNRPWAKP